VGDLPYLFMFMFSYLLTYQSLVA